MNFGKLEIIDCEQGSDEWFQCRAGKVTASMLKTVKAQGKTKGSPSETRAKYLRRLVGERFSGQYDKWDTYSNPDMQRGKDWEAEARERHAIMLDEPVELCGFMSRGDVGCSPDGLIGKSGMAQYKTAIYSIQVDTLSRDEVPSEHIAQIQGELWISGREWIDFVSFSPGLPLYRKRVKRDEQYIVMLKMEVDKFLTEMNVMLADLKRRYA